MASKLVLNRISRLLLAIGPLTTLAISPFFSFDPINPIKTLIVSSIALSILALMMRNKSEISARIPRLPLFISILFLSSLLVPFLLSGSSKSEQFFGNFGRNNGLLSYFCLVVIFLATVFVRNSETYKSILLSLLLTSVPMTFYCLIQIAGKDPFSWSAFAAFGTLGNVNFLSAFFGLSALTVLYYLSLEIHWPKKIGLVLLLIFQLGIVWQTDSIQGLMMFAAGISLLFLSILFRFSRALAIAFVFFLGTIFYFVLQSFVNKGPLSSFIYQPSITYRGDYMAAAINIFKGHVLTGVGLDSYGDWYRAERGVIATFRTGYGRTSNAAHNIYLDMAANGGIFVFAAFVILNLFVLFVAFKALQKTVLKDKLLNITFTLWVVFQVQALVSIAQIGVTIWGWLIGGSLLGYSKIILNSSEEFQKDLTVNKKPQKVTLDAASSLIAFLGFSIGFILAFVPFKIDMDYRGFSQKGQLDGMVEVTRNPFATSYFYTHAQLLAMSNNYQDIAYELNSRLREKFPREIAGWFVLANIQKATEQERQIAKQKVKELDPYFFCFEPDFVELIKNEFIKLPQPKQRELALGWGADSGLVSRADFTLQALGDDYLNQKIVGFCS